MSSPVEVYPKCGKKFQPVIEVMRTREDPKTMDWFQYLAEEMQKESKRRGDNLLV